MVEDMETFKFLEQLVVEYLDKNIRDVRYETQNSDYEGFTCNIDNKIFRSRRAKSTPIKKGYFVAFWEKDSKNLNSAYKSSENVHKLIITIFDTEKKGQFVFPQDILIEKGILKNAKDKGKMAMRIYPNWCVNLNVSATKTQKWQSNYFIDLTKDIDKNLLTKLYLR